MTINEMVIAITEYINPAMLGAILALWVLGYALKKTPQIKNWAIIWIIIFVGIVAGLMIVGLNADGVIQGILAASIAVLGHQTVKQTGNAINETQTHNQSDGNDVSRLL